jgi:type II secretory ATPase GspE/PulE/Tfp pilus assembly ATPase PilB-like protein
MVESSFNQMVQHRSSSIRRGVRAPCGRIPIIMVGEIRDRPAEMAVQSALTGLVLSTLHTNDAPSAVTRY